MSDPVTIPRFMAFDIGCIECGEESGVVGFYGTREEAKAAADAATLRHQAKWRGQHYFEVIDLTNPPISDYAASEETE